MGMGFDILLFAAGLVLLLKGASIFTQNASGIAKSLGLSDIVIGLTLVAFTTSLPELAVSVASVAKGSSGIALGNIIGSNIANIGLVLGVAALLTPKIPASRAEVKQGYIMLSVTVVAAVFILDGLSLLKGAVLVSSLLVYIYYLTRDKELKENIVEKIIERRSLSKGVALCAVGAAGVLFGAQLLVDSSIRLAESFGVPEAIIGLTVIAVGTSLPELATSVTAAMKKLEGIALGNIIGSNIFNLMMVMGVASMVGSILPEAALLSYSLPMMVLLSVLLVLLMRMENKIGRMDGAALVAIYAFFIYLKFFAQV